ncbi:hypothetical protein Poli38472_011792 [Pythium oligandrum]|uniref:BZIP domain-containing protein n=1 Tax=Pythium oligandrum TaxID=41045 RepID=A0A8K1C848_PYTOL|nr:hypothetical protein Poli38472_011792 [Pythium oligandrum]|eukprot:TMW58204.1 hypothetical protein Poli38472_011792 [Pythium oligandrum]
MTGTLTPTMDQAEPKRARLKTDRRREQCRQNQARYRKRQGLRIISLEKAVVDLQQQIRRYELQRRSLIHQTVDPRDASVKTVIELFRLFRHGLDVGRTNPSVVEMSSGQTSRSPRLEKQLAFIRAAVAEDVRVDDERGQDSFIEQVERFTKFFDGSRIHSHVVENVVVGPEGTTIVHVRLELDLTITTTTIRQYSNLLVQAPAHSALHGSSTRVVSPESGALPQQPATPDPALETAVRDLKHQITGYEEQRRSLIQAMDTREASVKTVLEFSRLFRHGLDVGGGNAPVVTVCTSPVRTSLLEKQLAFIEATFAKDMRVRDFNGREWLIEQTERFSTFFGAHELRPSAIENVAIDPCGGSTIYARVELDLTITLTTIRQVFPHLSTLLTLKWTLLGHQMRCPASVVYELDADSKVVRADWSIDFITGLLGALSIGEVGFVLHNARIQHVSQASIEHYRVRSFIVTWSHVPVAMRKSVSSNQGDEGGSHGAFQRLPVKTVVSPSMEVVRQPEMILPTGGEASLPLDDPSSCQDNNYVTVAQPSATAQDTTTHQTEPAKPKPKRKRVRLKTERRREQCRRNQARYRNKQRLQVLELEVIVADLHSQIGSLEEQCRSLYYSVNLRESSAKVVMEYFRLFRHGLDVDSLIMVPFSMPTTRQWKSARLDQQLEFLEAVMTDDIRIGDVYGRESFIEQTKCFTTYYDDLLLRLFALDCVSIGPEATTTVHATLELGMTITPTTIRYVYPHIQSNAALKWKLLGQRLCCSASGSYQFDESQSITSVDWKIDFVTGLLDVLTIEEVGIVLQDARIVHDAYLDSLDQGSDMLYAPEEGAERMESDVIVEPLQEPTTHRRRESQFEWRHENGSILRHDGQGDDFVMV